MKNISFEMNLPIHKKIHVFAKSDGQTVQEVDIIYTHCPKIKEYKTGKRVDAPGLSDNQKEALKDRVLQEYHR